jgi:Arm DNA-binding domain
VFLADSLPDRSRPLPPIPGFYRVQNRVSKWEKPGMLTDIQCRKAKPASTPYKLTDGGGLHLYVTPAGGKHWRYRYEIGGKEKLLSIGPYFFD